MTEIKTEVHKKRANILLKVVKKQINNTHSCQIRSTQQSQRP